MIPLGIIINSLAILIGGVLGWLLHNHMANRIKEVLPVIFGFCSFAIGIKAITKIESISIVIVSLLIGTVIGELIHIDDHIKNGIRNLLNFLTRKSKAIEDENIEGYQKKQFDIDSLAVVVTIFCFSGTGIFGALHEGMTGDSTILLAKASLDFFAAILFASTVGVIVALIAFPQLILFTSLFLIAKVIGSYLTVPIINNFIAVGGIITLMIGFTLLKLKSLKILNTLPGLIIVLVISYVIY